MRLLDRYLLRELLLPLGFCLGGFLIFWIAFDLFGEMQNFQKNGLGLRDVALYYLITTPQFLAIVLPVALLLALLYALTQHAKHHELTAMRAAGISLWRLCVPYFVVGMLFSLALFAVNEFLVPDTDDRAEALRSRNNTQRTTVQNFGFTNLREQRRWVAGNFNLITGELQKPQVDWKDADGNLWWLFAKRGVFINGSWTFEDVQTFRQAPGPGAHQLPVDDLPLKTMADFRETPDEFRSEVKIAGSLRLGSSRKTDIPVVDLLSYLQLHPKLSAKDHAWLHTKLHGRLAAPWTCLVVVLIAIPFGAPSGRRNVFVGVAGSIFICFGYFILQQSSLALGTGGYLAPWLAAWLPNVVFATAAIWLIGRVR